MCSYPNKTKKKESCEDVGQNVLEEKTCAEATTLPRYKRG